MADAVADKPWQDFRGQVVVVTGSSSGIGRQMAVRFATAGADVLVHAGHRRELAEELAGQLRNEGGSVAVLCADLSDSDGQDAFYEGAFRWRERIDVWINNAGVDVLTGKFSEKSFEEKLERLWSVDVAATVRLSRRAGAAMKASGGGVLLNVGWDQAEVGMEGDSGQMFSTTKGAVMSFTRSLAKTLAPQVRVNCLAPGWIQTRWGKEASAYWQRRAQDESLLGRWGTPQDVAEMALFLASPAARFVTGQTIAVNGGRR
jgi:3-oxoacyl-[acyl-carrier protein] reductase